VLLSRDYVGYLSQRVVTRLVAGGMIETAAAEKVVERVRKAAQEEIGIEERLNDEVRQILTDHTEEMKRTGVSYQDMYKKVKGELARQRKLILR
jgi:hypothetical protein